MSAFSICKICTIWGRSARLGMLSQPLLYLVSAVSCRRMKLLLGITLLASLASVWDNLVKMRSIQENGELRIESRIEEIIEPVREKIRDLKKSFTQRYSSVKFLSEKDCKIILVTGDVGFVHHGQAHDGWSQSDHDGQLLRGREEEHGALDQPEEL